MSDHFINLTALSQLKQKPVQYCPPHYEASTNICAHHVSVSQLAVCVGSAGIQSSCTIEKLSSNPKFSTNPLQICNKLEEIPNYQE